MRFLHRNLHNPEIQDNFEQLEEILTPTWKPVVFAADWANHGATDWPTLQYTRLSGLVVVHGLIKKPTNWNRAIGEVICSGLPAPELRCGFSCSGSDSALGFGIFRIDLVLDKLIAEDFTVAGANGKVNYLIMNFSYIPRVV